MPAPTPHPVRQRLKTFLTPKVADYILAESADITRFEVPEFGSPHPDTEQWPHHVFVHAVASDDQGLLDTYLYVKKRELQDDYAWEFSQANVEGGSKFDSVTREYVTLRSEFNPLLPLMGARMPDTPKSLFGTGSGTPRVLTDYYLAIRDQKRASDRELDNLFVIDRQVYIRRGSITDIDVDRLLGIGVGKTTTLHYRGEVMTGSSTIENLSADPSNAYWGVQADGTERSMQQISTNWWAVIVTSSRDAAFLAKTTVLPSTVDLSLPNVLTGVAVVWNGDDGGGSYNSEWSGLTAFDNEPSGSLQGAESARANGAASIQPDLVINMTQPEGRDTPSRSVFFYMKAAAGEITDAAFIARINGILGVTVARWPTFKPVAHTLVTKGMKVSVSAQASASASFSVADGGNPRISFDKNEGSGTDKDVSTVNGVTRIPPSIHALITLTGASDTKGATAQCDVGWTGTGAGDFIEVDGNTYPITFPSTTAAASISATAAGSVSPTALAATSPSAIPSTGYYYVKPRIEPVDSEWYRCYAEVFNAADI